MNQIVVSTERLKRGSKPAAVDMNELNAYVIFAGVLLISGGLAFVLLTELLSRFRKGKSNRRRHKAHRR